MTRTPTATKTPSATPTSSPTPYQPGVADAYEPDDWPWDARPLSIGAAAQQHTFHRPGDNDWARFNAVAGMTYLFDMTASSGTDLAWSVFAPAAQSATGEVLASGSAGRTVWRAPVTGVHLLEVKERTGRGGQGYSYTLAATALDRRIYLPFITTEAHATSGATTFERVIARSVLCDEAISSNARDCFGPDGGPRNDASTAVSGARDTGAAARSSGRALADRAEGQPPAGIQALALDARSGALYVVGQDTLARYDPAGRQILAQASIGRESGGIVLDEARGRVYVASGEQAALLALDARTLAPIARVGGFTQPGGVALAGDRLFVADTPAGAVRVLAADDFRVTAITQVGPGPYALAALPGQGHVFVAQSGGDSVARLDAVTGALVGVTPLGGLGHPQGMVADAQAGKVYVLYMLSPRYRQIAVLDGVTGAVYRVIPATLDRPLTDASALALDAARGRLLVGDSTGILAYDLRTNAWARAPVAETRGPAPIFGLAVDATRGALFTSSLADRAGRLQRLADQP